MLPAAMIAPVLDIRTWFHGIEDFPPWTTFEQGSVQVIESASDYENNCEKTSLVLTGEKNTGNNNGIWDDIMKDSAQWWSWTDATAAMRPALTHLEETAFNPIHRLIGSTSRNLEDTMHLTSNSDSFHGSNSPTDWMVDRTYPGQVHANEFGPSLNSADMRNDTRV
jgi:hypothetical protein